MNSRNHRDESAAQLGRCRPITPWDHCQLIDAPPSPPHHPHSRPTTRHPRVVRMHAERDGGGHPGGWWSRCRSPLCPTSPLPRSFGGEGRGRPSCRPRVRGGRLLRCRPSSAMRIPQSAVERIFAVPPLTLTLSPYAPTALRGEGKSSPLPRRFGGEGRGRPSCRPRVRGGRLRRRHFFVAPRASRPARC